MKNMRRWIACLAVVLLCMQPAMADEGMWLMHRLAEIYPQMKARGLKIKDKEIYNEKSAALADAVVAVDGGMGTGSMISDQGLMITNHHVAYSDICALSTPECNLLETGFWARTRDEEIPVPGKTVWFVRKVVDVTDEANALKEEMKAAGKWGMMAPRRLYAELEGRYGRETECEVSCYSMWGGKMYLMFYYDIYKDVRLVGVDRCLRRRLRQLGLAPAQGRFRALPRLCRPGGAPCGLFRRQCAAQTPPRVAGRHGRRA